ncbi:LiaF transmembrane domain-containing protein [Streptococcus intermedius]
MRKTLFGVGLLVLAGWILLQGNFGIPSIRFNFLPLLVVLVFAYFALENFWRGNLSGGVILAIISLIVANSSYHFLPISSGTIFLAGILASIGIGLIFKPKRIWGIYHGQNARRVINGDINFGSGTRYINSDDFTYETLDCAFGNATVYFDNATIKGNSATFDIDVSFGNATLYVPSNWHVELDVDNAFGTVTNPRNINEKDKTLYVKGDVSFGRLGIIYV